ncbi:DegT/DnrJ/EryC1/StrS family aminotransferase [Candidatus Saccharibacteria bacterium]|nr:DegT/DnrJ/EryC1/StrS family aminotransferase [Candidatus Saccharibacteria bacterium]
MTRSIITPIPAEAAQRRLMNIEEEIIGALRDTIHSGQYLLGDQVEALEQHISERWSSPLAVATSSGTTALQLALAAAKVGAGAEVIVPALTFPSTSFAVNAVGATPVFADIDPVTLTLSPAAVEKAITDKTAAIMPVHLYGQVADMDSLLQIAKAHNLKVIEDCAQAHGARLGDRFAGAMGDFGSFSFWVGKIAGGLEDAGFVLARQPESRFVLQQLRDIGRLPGDRYTHISWGLRGRMGEFTARVIQLEMDRLDEWLEQRRAIAARYTESFADLPLQLPRPAHPENHVYYKYTVLTKSPEHRQAIEQVMYEANIQPERIYPELVCSQPAYTRSGLPHRLTDLTVAEDTVHRLLCLPIYPELTPQEVDRVLGAVRAGCGAVKTA